MDRKLIPPWHPFTWVVVAFHCISAALALWGWVETLDYCRQTAERTFEAGCLEPPHYFALNVLLGLWLLVEIPRTRVGLVPNNTAGVC